MQNAEDSRIVPSPFTGPIHPLRKPQGQVNPFFLGQRAAKEEAGWEPNVRGRSWLA